VLASAAAAPCLAGVPGSTALQHAHVRHRAQQHQQLLTRASIFRGQLRSLAGQGLCFSFKSEGAVFFVL
jgi:hypothetical protein